jgi:hypothetical protein
MKRTIICLLLVSSAGLLFSQTANEIANFSQIYNLETARAMAMGGAVGALQAEQASLGVNPGSLGTFRMGQIMISPIMDIRKTKSTLLGTKGEDTRHNYSIDGANIVFSFDNSRHNFNRFNIAFGYKSNNIFNYYYDVQGSPSPEHSLAQELVNLGNESSEEMGLWVGGLPFVGPDANDPTKLALHGDYLNPSQQNHVYTSGNSGEYALSFGTSFKDKLYMGLSAGLSDFRFEKRATLMETAYFSQGSEVSLSYDTKTKTTGIGFNARLGLMYAPIEDLTLGLAVQSPTFYSLKIKENMQQLSSAIGGDKTEIEGDTYKYTLHTPWRFTVSAAYTFRSWATLSLDYELVTNNWVSLNGDFDEMPVPDAENIRAIKDYISDNYELAMNVRVGGEIRLSRFYVRAGFAYLGAPTKDITSIVSGSAGIGYRFGDASVDVGYRYASGGSEQSSLYRLAPLVNIDYITHQLMLTFTYRF